MADRVEIVVRDRDNPSGRHDAVLLDRDAVMTDGWLERLQRCAASDERIATVVPWHAGTLQPANAGVEDVNAALVRSAPRVYPDLDDTHAPCIFVRGRILREIGGRDVLRDRVALRDAVRDAGYRNALCDDAYAGGGASLHPSHGAPRNAAPIARMARTQLAIAAPPAKPGILHVLHSRGGGTEKYVRSIVAASRDELRHYFLRVAPDRWLFKDAMGEHAAACEWPRDAQSEPCLRVMCDWLAIDLVHVHSLVGSGDDLARMLASTGLAYCYSVHDMYAACPTVYLIDASGRYCNATTDIAACTACLAQSASFRDVDISQWRARYSRLLQGAAKVWAPSRWAGDTLRKYYPGANIEVRPHPIEPERAIRTAVSTFELPRDECRHIAVLGAIGPEKGARNVDALAEEIRRRSLPLRIVVVGFTDRARRWQSDDRTLTIHGSYGQDELVTLFDRYRIDVVVFPTIWPETFSYTLSEAWRAGRPALVPPGGALAERVIATGGGWLMRGWPDMASVADELVDITSDMRATEFREKCRLAVAAGDAEVRDNARAPYEGLTPSSMPPQTDPAALHGIYAAACRAMSIDPLPATQANEAMSARPSPLARLLRFVRP